MSKFSFIIAAAGFAGLTSCVPPEAPPPHFHPNPPYAPQPVDPYGNPDPVSPTPNPTPPPVSPPTATGGYPTAQRTDNPNQVLSPYEPYNVIDVEGFKSGQLARDPSNQKIFRVP